MVEYSRVMLTISFGEIIKIGIGRDAAKFILSPAFFHYFIRLLLCQGQIHKQIKFLSIGKLQAGSNSAGFSNIFRSNKEFPAFFLDMSQQVIPLISSVGNDNGFFNRRTVNHTAQGGSFIGIPVCD